MSLQPVIICGGEGKRLWPLSHKMLPKQFLNLFNNKSLFELTIERLQVIKDCNLPIIVVSKYHEFLVINILEKYKQKAKIILEPEGKNTTAAIYLAASYADQDDILLIMPSDHIIPNKRDFSDFISNAKSKLNNEAWMLFGIVPNEPSENFGYLHVEEKEAGKVVQIVKSFIEKPAIEKAIEMVSSGSYLWNSGIFMVSARKAILSIKIHANEVSKKCEKVLSDAKLTKNNSIVNFDQTLFSFIPNIAIDFSVLEKENKLLCMRFLSQWSDVGSWDKVLQIQEKKKLKQNLLEVDGSNELVTFQNRLIGTVGVSDLIIVDSKDATLITKKNRSSDLYKLTDLINNENNHLKIDKTFEIRPWGSFEVLLNNDICKVKQLNILPQKRLSLQFHKKRSEHWVVISGNAFVYINGKEYNLSEGQSIDIEKEAQHYIANKYETPLVIIEVQMGQYFGEDDITRLDDPYNR